MKSVLISIQPKWCELIASGKKTIEVRKTAPKLETPFKCYIYDTKGTFDITLCTDLNAQSVKVADKGRGKVIGEFVCDRIYVMENHFEKLSDACITLQEFYEYEKNSTVYGWHISDLKIYDKPKELSEFRKPCSSAPTARCYPDNCERCPWNTIIRPFQSWGYVEE